MPRKQPTLFAQGKPHTLGGSTRPWRVRLYAPESDGTKHKVMFRAPAGDGKPWKRVLRRASSEAEARKIFPGRGRARHRGRGACTRQRPRFPHHLHARRGAGGEVARRTEPHGDGEDSSGRGSGSPDSS